MWPHFSLKWAIGSILEALFLIALGSQGNTSILLPTKQKEAIVVAPHSGDPSAEYSPGTSEF